MNNFARPGLGATELPPVNADDNGKVLGVSDGAWAKVPASGGSDLPDDPAQDGTYNLQNTVSSGTGTLSWASGSSGGGVLVVNDTDGTLDKTWQEIADAGFAILRIENDIGITCSINHSDGYEVTFAMLLPNGSGFDSPIGYTTSTASGYPVMQ